MQRAINYALFGMGMIIFVLLIAMIAGCGKGERVLMGSEAVAIQACKTYGNLKALHSTQMRDGWVKLVIVCNNGAVIQLDYRP